MDDDLYRQYILDHYRQPRNHGTLDHPDIHAADTNPLCGDRVAIDLKLDGDRVSDVRFSGRGCAISQASASMLTDEIKGKPLEEIKHIDKQVILDMLGIPLGPTRIKCALLPLKVIKAGAYGIQEWGDEED